MYHRFFGLDREPFSISPDPAFLFPSSQHAEALAHLQYGLQREGGFILLTGEVGTGKTTLCRALLQNMPEHFRVAYIINARLESRDLLASICRELGVEVASGASVRELVESLNDYLLAVHARGEKTLLVVEEAQNLAPDVLETLRLLTNLETNTAKLLHILLVGQPELLDMIHRRELRQLNQRVIARSHLGPLSLPELRQYLSHRLHTAGASRDLFTRRAVAALYRHSGGIPRLVNLIADRALLGAYARSRDKVDASFVRKAAIEIRGVSDGAMERPWRYATLAGAVVLLPLLALLAYPRLVDYIGGGAAIDQQNQIATAVVAPVAPAEISPPPIPPPPIPQPSVFIQLLQLWDIGMHEEAVVDPQGLCRSASLAGLACLEFGNLNLDELLSLNRPALVHVVGDNGAGLVLLIAVNEQQVQINSDLGLQTMSMDEFSSRWQGDALLLWQPPPGYQADLKVGDKNPRMVTWLQRVLQQVLPESEILITGGRYSAALEQQVLAFQRLESLRADGIVGVETIIRCDDLLTDQPRLREG